MAENRAGQRVCNGPMPLRKGVATAKGVTVQGQGSMHPLHMAEIAR
ncbi:hypothetical protein APS_0828 [Acetobacter pasteurianus subsp. pasteurianus LMG 1262 = NBRC 106471]|nr:hypothetical protein [Acetobacter pasteurianus]GAB30226.1 hypothetical protein APS_0828 [Acetobacter pasteurianus subsp. pasteurianus LMG 1262 = NBRC 106471]